MSLDKSNVCAHDRTLDNEEMSSSGALSLGNNYVCQVKGVTLCMCSTQISRQSCLPCSTLDHASHIPTHGANFTWRKMRLCSQDTCHCSPDSDTPPWASRTTARNVKPSTHKPAKVIFHWLRAPHTFAASLMLTTNTWLHVKTAFTLLATAVNECLTLFACLICHILPIMLTSICLSFTLLATATHISIQTTKARPIGRRWHNRCIIQLCTVCASLLTINVYILANLHTIFQTASGPSNLKTSDTMHWFFACLPAMHVRLTYKQIVNCIADAITQAINILANKPKRPSFQHPTFRCGKYWRRVRNRTRKLHHQMLYMYVKLLHRFYTYLKTHQSHSTVPETQQPDDSQTTRPRHERNQSNKTNTPTKEDNKPGCKAETEKRKKQRKPKKERLKQRQTSMLPTKALEVHPSTRQLCLQTAIQEQDTLVTRKVNYYITSTDMQGQAISICTTQQAYWTASAHRTCILSSCHQKRNMHSMPTIIKHMYWNTKATTHWSHTKPTHNSLRTVNIHRSSNIQPTPVITNSLPNITTPCSPPHVESYISSIIHAIQSRADSSTTQICWGGGTHNHVKPHENEPDLGPNNDLYAPFSYNGQDWLNSNQILKCVLYMLHIKYSTAKHQNLAGVTHPVAQLQELLTKAKQAGTNKALEASNDIPQVMRDSSAGTDQAQP